MLSHVFGATGVAISTVVTCFMAGLGLGAWVGGRYADRIRHPIFAYGVAELGVGLWGVLVPILVDSQGWLAEVNRLLRLELGADSTTFMIARFFCVLPILLIPTTLMGASLPLLTRHFVHLRDDANGVSARVGALYSVNTFGAVCGVFLASFILLPTVGLAVTNWVAVSLNILLFIGIFILRAVLLAPYGYRKGDRLEWLPAKDAAVVDPPDSEQTQTSTDRAGNAPEAQIHPEQAQFEGAVSTFARIACFVTFAVSGAAALCYEVVWSRALAMTIGSSVYSFGIILLTFLIGIGGGSAMASAILGPSSRLLHVAGFAATVLLVLASSLFAIGQDGGLGVWFGMSLLCSTPVMALWASGTFRLRAMRAAGHRADSTRTALLIALMPAAFGLFCIAMFRDHLGTIVGVVVSVIALFLIIQIALRRYPVLQLALTQLFIALSSLVNYLFQDEIPCAFAALVTSVPAASLPEQISLVQLFMFACASLCTLPATMGMGAMFPQTIRLWTRGGTRVGRDVGFVYAGNTLGSIVGAWLPGFVLIQLVGMEATLKYGIYTNLALALLMLVAAATEGEESESRAAPSSPRQPDPGGQELHESKGPHSNGTRVPAWHSALVYVLAPMIPAIVALLHLGTMHPDSTLRWSLSQMTLGVFRVSLADEACNPEVWGAPDLVYYEDGLSTTVSVERWGRHYALKNNGKVDASNGDDMSTQIMVGAYPILMHAGPTEDLDIAVIGWGSGVTVGSALEFPIHSLQAIELERSILRASQFFEDVNHLSYTQGEFPYVEHERLSVINDDGRNYLASTDALFDVIISEPSNPWITGVSDLFTTDHFQATKNRLKEGGIYCQWVQLYELSPENIKSIYRTFASQFEHVVVFSAEDLSSDTVLLGSDGPLPLDLGRIDAAFALPGVAEELERAEVRSAFDILSRVLFADRSEVMQFAQIEYRLRGGSWQPLPAGHNAEDSSCVTGKPPRVTDTTGFWIAIASASLFGLLALSFLVTGTFKWLGRFVQDDLECSSKPRARFPKIALGLIASSAASALSLLAGTLAFVPEDPPGTCVREPAPLNTDDNAHIEFAAPRDLIGYRRYEGYLSNLYAADWPYGRLVSHAAGFGEGASAGRNYAELAMSLLAHGRRFEAAQFISMAQELGDDRSTLIASLVLTLLSGDEGEPQLQFQPPTPPSAMASAEAELLETGFHTVNEALEAGDHERALFAMEEIPSPVRMHSGPGMRFLYGYLLFKNGTSASERYQVAVDTLDELVVSEPQYAKYTPEVYYFLARTHLKLGEFAKAQRQMRRYAELRYPGASAKEHLHLPNSGDAP